MNFDEVAAARKRLEGVVHRTPVMTSRTLDERAGCSIFLKCENFQRAGAFKIRGATNRIAALDAAERARGVVTVSTGNHGRAVAQAARRHGVKAIVCMSNLVPRNKLDAIAGLGAEVRIVGQSQDEAEVEAERLAAEHGMVMVSPFDDAHVIAGQGTIGLELIGDWPELDTVLVPVSGGGLISGIAVAVKAYRPDARIIGVSMDQGAAMVQSQRAGRPVSVEEAPSLADSLGGGIGLDNAFTFALVRDTVDELVLVTEAEIAQAMRHVFREERLVAEGGACVGIAVLLNDRADRLGDNIAVVVSGANVDLDRFLQIVGGAEQS